MKTRVVLKAADGSMGFINIEMDPDSGDYPDELTSKDGSKAVLRDWMSQFGAGSIPVYEEVTDEG